MWGTANDDLLATSDCVRRCPRGKIAWADFTPSLQASRRKTDAGQPPHNEGNSRDLSKTLKPRHELLNSVRWNRIDNRLHSPQCQFQFLASETALNTRRWTLGVPHPNGIRRVLRLLRQRSSKRLLVTFTKDSITPIRSQQRMNNWSVHKRLALMNLIAWPTVNSMHDIFLWWMVYHFSWSSKRPSWPGDRLCIFHVRHSNSRSKVCHCNT